MIYSKQTAGSKNKGIATQTLVLVIMMGMFAFAAFMIWSGWREGSDTSVQKAGCISKRLEYCTSWKARGYSEDPWDWHETVSDSCARLGIYKPTQPECENE